MKKFFAALLVLSVFCFGTSCGNSSKNDGVKIATDDKNEADGNKEEEKDEPYEEKLESIRNLAEEYVNSAHGTGVVIGYGKDKLTSLAYGIRDVGTEEPLSTDDLFEIGSITKNFTAVTMILLQEEGKVDLDQTIDKWFPDFEKGDIITVRMLLNHPSGILEWNEFDDLEGMVDKVNGKFTFEPGTDWAYSNTNFVIAGLIINKVAGKDAVEVIREKIIDPLGMKHTFMKNFEKYPVEEKAAGHTFDEYGNIIPYELNERFWTAGGIVSNVEDMFKYAHALFNGELLSEESMDQMLDIVYLLGKPMYGLGTQYGEGSHSKF